jgi:hypothetical protein
MPVLTPCNQRIDAYCRLRSVSCLVVFHCRPLNGNGKIIILCVLCVSSEAGGEYKLTYLHSKAWTISIAEGLMGQLKGNPEPVNRYIEECLRNGLNLSDVSDVGQKQKHVNAFNVELATVPLCV